MAAKKFPTPRFDKYIKGLPAVPGDVFGIEIWSGGKPCATIPNEPGKDKALKIYHFFLDRDGSAEIDAHGARAALTWFAEHSDEARRNPVYAREHFNVGRLFPIANGEYTVIAKAIYRQPGEAD